METMTMPQKERRITETAQAPIRMFGGRMSWASMFAGVVVVYFVMILFSSLGAGIGANVATASTNVSSALGAGAIIWFLLSVVAAMFIGGWVSGRLSGLLSKSDGALQGFITACLSTVLLMFMLTTALAGMFGNASAIIGSGLLTTPGFGALEAGIGAAVNADQIGQAAAQAVETAGPATAASGYGIFAVLLIGSLFSMWGGAVSATGNQRTGRSAY